MLQLTREIENGLFQGDGWRKSDRFANAREVWLAHLEIIKAGAKGNLVRNHTNSAAGIERLNDALREAAN